MNYQQPQPGRPAATNEQVHEAQKLLRELRDQIARFHEARRRNNERMAGMRASMIHPQQLQAMARSQRDQENEQRFIEQLRQLLRVMRGHEPTRQEMQAGIPENFEGQLGMGLWPAIIVTSLVAVAVPAYQYARYLTAVEERLEQESATPMERGLRALSDNIKPIALIGALGAGVYVYHTSTRTTRLREELQEERARDLYEERLLSRHSRRPPRRRRALPPSEEEDYEAEETWVEEAKRRLKRNPDEPSLFERAADMIRNAFAPASKDEDDDEEEYEEEEYEEEEVEEEVEPKPASLGPAPKKAEPARMSNRSGVEVDLDEEEFGEEVDEPDEGSEDEPEDEE